MCLSLSILLALTVSLSALLTDLCALSAEAAENELFYVPTIADERFFVGGMQAMCNANGGRLYVPDSEAKFNLIPSSEVVYFFGMSYFFDDVSTRFQGEWRYVDHNNVSLQRALGDLAGKGGIDDTYPFVKNNSVYSNFVDGTVDELGRRRTTPYNGVVFPLATLATKQNDKQYLSKGCCYPSYNVVCERVLGAPNDLGVEALILPVAVGCDSGDRTVFDRVCQARNKRLFQPNSGTKDLVLASQVYTAISALPEDQRIDAVNAMYLIGGSYNSDTDEWRWHDINERPTGAVISSGRCRPDGYHFENPQPPDSHAGWAANHYTKMVEPFCSDDASNNRIAFTYASGSEELVRGGGWRARSFETGCTGTRLHVVCENLPAGLTLPDTGIVVVTELLKVGAGSALPLCSLTDNTLQPAIIDSVEKQAELERKVMAGILTGSSAEQEANSNVSVLLGASFVGQDGMYPIASRDVSYGDWLFYADGTIMQNGFTVSDSSGYNKWFSGYPKVVTGPTGFLTHVQLAYNMNIGGWVNLAQDDGYVWLACEKAPTTQALTSTIQLEPTPAGVAPGALSELCITRGLAPVAIDTAAKQTELIVKTIEMLKESSLTLQVTDTILLNGRYTSDVYPPNLLNGYWVHTATGARFMRGHSLSTMTTATAYQSWTSGKNPVAIVDWDSGREAGLTLAFRPSSGGWINPAVNAAVASWVACVAGSGQKTETEMLSETLLLPAVTSEASVTHSAGVADSVCIERDPTSRGLAITSAAVQAALEFAMLKRLDAADSTDITSDVIVLLAASYDDMRNEWYWTGSGESFTTGYSLFEGARADNRKQYQNWAVGYPRRRLNGSKQIWFSLEKGGWVNTPPSDKQIIVCESGHEQYQDDTEKLFTVTAPTGVATLSQAPDQASVLCEANSDPSGVPYPIVRSENLWHLEMGIVAKLSDGSLTAGDVVVTDTTLADVQSKSLRVSWAAGYPDTSDPSATTFIAYDTTLMGFVNVKADAANFIVACYQMDTLRRDVVIMDSREFLKANIAEPRLDPDSLSDVCAFGEPPASPIAIQNAGAQHILQVVEMRDIFRGKLTPGEPILTSGRYSSASDDWAWSNDQSRKFATGISGASFGGAYTNWPSGFTGTSGNIILANSAGMGVWTSVDGASTSYFVACQYPLDVLYSFVVLSPEGLPDPKSAYNVSVALCRFHDPPGLPLISNDTESQRGLELAVRRAVALDEIASTTDVLLTRATVGAGGSVSWHDGTPMVVDTPAHIQWASGYPQSGATLMMLAFNPTLAGWVNVAPTAAGTPYSLACQTCSADNTECFQRTSVFLVPVATSGSSRRIAMTRSAGVPDAILAGWAACAAHDGAPVQVLNASVDVEVQTLSLRHYMNSSDTLLQQRSTTPVLLGAYKDNATNQWGWIDPLQLTDKLTPATYTNWASEPAEGDNYASFVLSDGQWLSHGPSEVPTVAACVPYDYTIYVSPPPPPVNPGDESSSDSSQPDWSDPFAVCALNGGVPLRVFTQNLQAALEANVSAAAADAPDVILLGGEFAGDTFSGAWQWMVKSSDTGHGPAFTQNYALDSDPAAVPVDGAYTKWAHGYPKLTDAAETAPSATLLAYSKSAGGWINVNPTDGPYQVMCTLSQGPDDGYTTQPDSSDAGNGEDASPKSFPWWIILAVVLAVVVVLLVVLIVVLCCCCRRKKDKTRLTHFDADEAPPEGLSATPCDPAIDLKSPVINPLIPPLPAATDAPALTSPGRPRKRRRVTRHANTSMVDVNTDFLNHNTEIREDDSEDAFSPAEDDISVHSVELL